MSSIQISLDPEEMLKKKTWIKPPPYPQTAYVPVSKDKN